MSIAWRPETGWKALSIGATSLQHSVWSADILEISWDSSWCFQHGNLHSFDTAKIGHLMNWSFLPLVHRAVWFECEQKTWQVLIISVSWWVNLMFVVHRLPFLPWFVQLLVDLRWGIAGVFADGSAPFTWIMGNGGCYTTPKGGASRRCIASDWCLENARRWRHWRCELHVIAPVHSCTLQTSYICRYIYIYIHVLICVVNTLYYIYPIVLSNCPAFHPPHFLSIKDALWRAGLLCRWWLAQLFGICSRQRVGTSAATASRSLRIPWGRWMKERGLLCLFNPCLGSLSNFEYTFHVWNLTTNVKSHCRCCDDPSWSLKSNKQKRTKRSTTYQSHTSSTAQGGGGSFRIGNL